MAIAIGVILNFNVSAQEKKIYKGEIPASLKIEKNSPRENQNHKTSSKEVLDFQNKMRIAKESGDRNESKKLVSEIDNKLGTKTVSLVKREMPENNFRNLNLQPENFDTSKIYHSENFYYSFKCVTTCTVQRGTNAGRVYTSAIIQEDNELAFMGIFYSDNNGSSWTEYLLFDAYIWEQTGYEQFFKFTMDAEIIEGTNSKFLYITYPSFSLTAQGLAPSNGLAVIDLNSNQVNLSYLFWPGMFTYDPPFVWIEFNTYDVKMVSDNSRYTNNAWLYFVAKCDSIFYNYPTYTKQGEKVAVCLDPYELYPDVSYNPGNFMGMITDGSINNFDCDLAYFYNNGEDSIMVVESGLETNSSIAIGTASIFEILTNCYYRGELSTDFNPRKNIRIASNGAYKNLMIICENRYSGSDNDIEYYKSSNGSAGWTNGFVDYTIYNSKGTGILGKRNDPGNFSVAYNSTYGGYTNAAFCKSSNYIWGEILHPFSLTESDVNCLPYPAIAFNGINNISMAIWSDDIALQPTLWSSSTNVNTIKNLFLFGAIQGLYDPAADEMLDDTVTVYLRNTSSPFAKIDSSKKELYGPGTGQYFTFNNAQNNIPYYVEVKHRNALETWSAVPVTFVSDNTSIAFSVDAIYAYGNNEIQVDDSPYNVFAFYSGDVNQDGIIDASDLSIVENDVSNSVSGYVPADLNGDDFVDASDLSIVENNVALGVFVVTP